MNASTSKRSKTLVGESIAGTLDYAAPEQMGKAEGAKVGTYSDVYSFGKTCYYALLGTPEPDDEEKERLPPIWRKLLSNCTARTIDKRLQDFGVVLERLDPISAERVTEKQSQPGRPVSPPQARRSSEPIQVRPGSAAEKQDLQPGSALAVAVPIIISLGLIPLTLGIVRASTARTDGQAVFGALPMRSGRLCCTSGRVRRLPHLAVPGVERCAARI